jgi:hypothetical protein
MTSVPVSLVATMTARPGLRVIVVFASLAGVLLGGTMANAQERAPAPKADVSSAPPTTSRDTHRFWDTENAVLFSGVAGARAMDYASTRHFRALGATEWLLTNRIVDNTPLFVTIEAAATAASIGVSYLLHRTNHHTLERWVSFLHIGITVGGAAHNYTLHGPATLK